MLRARWLEAIRLPLLLALLTLGAPGDCLAAGEKAARPNIVLIVADDLGFSDLGCYGGEIPTPRIDSLAAAGTRYLQFYNCAVCVTTRASLMTGLSPRQGPGGLLRTDMVTIAEVMKAAGYRTAMTGKWHLGSQAPKRPIDRGFDEFYGLLDGCCNYFNPAQRDPEFYNGGRQRAFAHNGQPITSFPEDYYTTDAFAEHASGVIRDWSKGQQPFFLHVAFTAPHFPLHAPEEDIAQFHGKYDDGYFALRERRFQRQQQLGLLDPRWQLSTADKKLGPARYDYEIVPWDQVENLQRERRRMEVYAAMVARLDRAVGRILETLRESGAEDNTLVMFLSDNGGCATLPADREGMQAYNRSLPGGADTYDFVGPGWGWAQNTPFRRYKTFTYEGGIATPMIVRWPGHTPRGTIDRQTVGHVMDLLPTCLELAGGEYPTERQGQAVLPVEGRSLAAAFRGKPQGVPEELCWELYGSRAIRVGKWKLVWGVTGKRWELYDMEADRTETTDLAAQHPDLVAQLAKRWEAWNAKCMAPASSRP